MVSNNNINIIGKRIKVARVMRGVTRKELAARTNRTYTTIFNWETGKSEPRARAKRRVERELGLEPGTIDKGLEVAV